MPVKVQPPSIELSDFTQGVVLGVEDAAVPDTALLDANNLLVDPTTGSLVTRKGYARLFDSALLDGYRIESLHPYNYITVGTQTRYLMVVASNGLTTGNDNIIVLAHDVDAETTTKVSPTMNWSSDSGRHWGATIDNFFFGGGETNEMYRWIPTGGAAGTWTSAVSDKTWDLWVEDSTSPGAGEVSGLRAFEDGDTVRFEWTVGVENHVASFTVKPKQGIRKNKWKQGTDAKPITYEKGDRRSRKANGFWQTFRCVREHESTTANPRPPEDTPFRWKHVQMPPPVNEDGEKNTRRWTETPDAPVTAVAEWHGNRLWARHDNYGKQQLVASAQAKAKKVGELRWNPQDWRIGSSDGAFVSPVESEDGDDIEAIASFGFYLLVFKRKSTFVLRGTNAEEFTFNPIAPVGAAGPRAWTEHEGYIYFFGDEGFFRTEGTVVEPVPGGEKVAQWLKTVVAYEDGRRQSTLWSYDGYVWLSLTSTVDNTPNITLTYDPVTESFMPHDLHVVDVTVMLKDGLDQLFFAVDSQVGTSANATFAWLGAQHRSKSTRTIAGVVQTNHLKNPGFEADNQWGGPLDWDKTYLNSQPNSAKLPHKHTVKTRVTAKAGIGKWDGLEVHNNRPKSGSLSVGGSDFDGHEGIVQNVVTDNVNSHTLSFYARRLAWKKNPKKRPPVKAFRGATERPVIWSYHGRGWYRGTATVTGSTTGMDLALVIPQQYTVQFDRAMLIEGADFPWFWGEGGTEGTGKGTVGGGRGLVMWYGHPDHEFEEDTAQGVQVFEGLRWFVRTAWLSFGVIQEERQVRDIWAMVAGDEITIGLSGMSNYRPEGEWELTATAGENEPVTYFLGSARSTDSFAYALEVQGHDSPASLQALGLNTVPRRLVRSKR